MSKYFVEYGALQADAKRLIECDTSALPAVKITEGFAREIADALNSYEPGASLNYRPSDAVLDEIENIANRMIWSSMQGGGVILEMVKDYRAINAERKRVLPNSNESEVQGL